MNVADLTKLAAVIATALAAGGGGGALFQEDRYSGMGEITSIMATQLSTCETNRTAENSRCTDERVAVRAMMVVELDKARNSCRP